MKAQPLLERDISPKRKYRKKERNIGFLSEEQRNK
jgi:hypothetical protein